MNFYLFQAGLNDDYHCTCAPGFHGPHCEFTSDFDICTKDNPCENGATCMSDMRGYSCVCPPGFEGRNCEKVIDLCKNNPCLNEGICFPFINDYKCVCQNGFTGRTCADNYDDCQNQPCANGGLCEDGLGRHGRRAKEGVSRRRVHFLENFLLQHVCQEQRGVLLPQARHVGEGLFPAFDEVFEGLGKQEPL